MRQNPYVVGIALQQRTHDVGYCGVVVDKQYRGSHKDPLCRAGYQSRLGFSIFEQEKTPPEAGSHLVICCVLYSSSTGSSSSSSTSSSVPSFEPDFWQEDIRIALDSAGEGQIVIGSFQGTNTGEGFRAFLEDHVETARLLKETGVPMMIVNLSCPNEGTSNLLCFDVDRVEQIANEKIKKNDDEMTLTLVRNPDILASIASMPEGPFCVGFAAETQNVEKFARGKLDKKKLDLIAANLVGQPDTPVFGADTNTLDVYWANLGHHHIAAAPKKQVAAELLDIIAERLAER